MSTERNFRQYRQGDVLLKAVDAIPEDAVAQQTQNGVIVLAFGEATGHAHVVDSALATMYKLGQKDYIKARAGACLRHEEHSALSLEPGSYEVIRQREYEPAGWRGVSD